MSGVFDASAVVAAVLGEPGEGAVRDRLAHGLITTVNFAECVERLAPGFGIEGAMRAMLALELTAVPPSEGLAARAAALRPLTRAVGLSLGDRFCLALAAASGLPAITADRNWSRIAEAIGVEVIQIR